ncbi:MAG: hypothetical protein AUJ92_00900 [Armatimonadetes bacterium CG2_30_59_28]|nr:hypothetical protein [Armatimonadota bacterium]OIO98690.1 MAG: hypothetical protein AUJ92_00900 [Armatimonadetes bacterium CG2_30_59_28]PIU63423.1 MAG: hypothetical protein COS85_16080 [Armatimonadetes bacterium CG07_land_8_20_14_0_80_59_28]
MESITPRIDRLRRALTTDCRRLNSRVLFDAEEGRWYRAISERVYSRNLDSSEVARKAKFLQSFAEEFPCAMCEDELIVGSQRFCPPWRACGEGWAETARNIAFRGNNGHIIVDYGHVLREGVSGLLEEIDSRVSGDQRATAIRQAFRQALHAFSTFICRHAQAARLAAQMQAHRCDELLLIAENCERISWHPPETFHQALQLVWFIQVFLHAEGCGAAVSFGRFDQYLWPFLEKDIFEQRISTMQSGELIACFFLKCCEGDESQNIIFGGVDEDGNLAENPLSLVCLQVAADLKLWQPSVSVRIGPETSDEFWSAALRLCQAGIGMPSFFNDPVVIGALQAVGIPLRRARDYGIVGCYEATPQGDTYGLTVNHRWVLPETLLEFLRNREQPVDFSSLLRDFKSHLRSSWQQQQETLQANWNQWARDRCSPFESVCTRGCIASGMTAEEGGGSYNLLGVNILGLGTLVDSLLVIRELVCGQPAISLRDLVDQTTRSFPDGVFQNRCRGLSGKYGTDTSESSTLVGVLSSFIADLVLATRLDHGVRPNPAFFAFSGDIYHPVPATPDGRNDGEFLSYGCGPGTLANGTSPTSILNSAAHVAHSKCACGNPLTLSLSINDARGEEGAERVRRLVQGYFEQGGFHLHFNLIDADQLREAQKNPDAFPELTVRVSGYSAVFQHVDRRWQDAIIERTEKGM